MQNHLPSRLYAWYTVILLTLTYVIAYVDRSIIGLLVEPMKRDMGLSDTQMAFLMGPAFAIFYTTLGLPLGWMADRGRRNLIVGTGVALWSLATSWCGLARNYTELFAARVSVGVGEATLNPCALSMIADSFEPEKRGKPVAFYSAALSLGAGIAALVGASVIIWSKTVDNLSLPLVGEVAPWQFAFIVVGLAGLPLSVLMFLLREPPREQRAADAANEQPGLRDAFRHLWENRSAYGGFVSLVCVMTTVAYSQVWLAPMFDRTWGWPPEDYAIYSGIALLVAGPLTVNLCGWYSDRLSARGVREAPLKILRAGALVLIPTGALAPLMPGAWWAFALFACNTVGLAMVSAVAPTTLLNITPGAIRGQVVAIYFLVISLAGLLLGPMTVGLLNDLVMGEGGLRYSLALVPVVYGIPVLIFSRRSLRSYVDALYSEPG